MTCLQRGCRHPAGDTRPFGTTRRPHICCRGALGVCGGVPKTPLSCGDKGDHGDLREPWPACRQMHTIVCPVDGRSEQVRGDEGPKATRGLLGGEDGHSECGHLRRTGEPHAEGLEESAVDRLTQPHTLPAPCSEGRVLEGEQPLGVLAGPPPSGCDPASSEALPPEWRTCRLRDRLPAPAPLRRSPQHRVARETPCTRGPPILPLHSD